MGREQLVCSAPGIEAQNRAWAIMHGLGNDMPLEGLSSEPKYTAGKEDLAEAVGTSAGVLAVTQAPEVVEKVFSGNHTHGPGSGPGGTLALD